MNKVEEMLLKAGMEPNGPLIELARKGIFDLPSEDEDCFSFLIPRLARKVRCGSSFEDSVTTLEILKHIEDGDDRFVILEDTRYSGSNDVLSSIDEDDMAYQIEETIEAFES